MTFFTPETLYRLLPAIYRIRDEEGGLQDGPLRALVEVLGEQAAVMEEDIARLYDNWFIETCDEWVVPYIGDLLGVRHLHAFDSDIAFSHRARVANTLAYRRRKGTATMLEQLAFDTTGWRARAVEFFELLATTQYVNHVRTHNHRAPDLRDTDRLDLLDTAFDTIAHTADVRRIASGRGRHNIPNVGLFLWRLQSYPVERSEARAVADPSDGRYHFHPYGLDVPLFNRPQTEAAITHLAEEVNVPGRLRRRPLYDELEALRAASSDDAAPAPAYFRVGENDDAAADDAPVKVWFDGSFVTPEQLLICNLEGWDEPGWSPPSSILGTQVAVDPVVGRLALLSGVDVPERVEVSFAYGFPGDVGGGPYNRRTSLDAVLDRAVDWQVSVGKTDTDADYPTITAALKDPAGGWNSQSAGRVGVIAILDNASYEEDLTGDDRIEIPDGSLLVIVAATAAGGVLKPDERRAHLIGDVEVVGTAQPKSTTPGTLVLDGLLIEGAITVLDGSLGALRMAHATVGLHDRDAPSGVIVAGGNPELQLELDHGLCGPIIAPETIRGVRLLDSVVQAASGAGGRGPVLSGGVMAPGPPAETAPGPPAVIERSTLLGRVHVRELSLGSESLFTEPVEAERLQVGCVRFSYVPEGSRTPRRYRCQPWLALRQHAEALGLRSAGALPAEERLRIVRRVKPAFTATRYGDPAYAQLALTCAEEIRTGAEDGSEMGVWSLLKQPQRLANLEASLDDYLRFGLEAGLLFAT